MSSNLGWRIAVLVAVALTACWATASWAQSVSNGTFESWSGSNTADNWTSFTTTGSIAGYKGSTFTGTPAVTAHGGAECQRVKLASASSSQSEGGVYQRFLSTPGTTYTVSAYLLTRLTNAGAVEARLGVDRTGATAPGANTVWSSGVTGDAGWTKKTASVTATGSYVTIFLSGKHPTYDTTQCNVFFDDVSVCISPAAPTGVSASPVTIYSGMSSTLSASAAAGCTVDWYTDGCDGTLAGSGTSLVVTPQTTTTYYARARNTTTGCSSSTCVQATVSVQARVVTITPSNMAEYGWQTATSNGGTCSFTLGGPVASEYAGYPTFPSGRGAIYATCDEISDLGSTPSTVWVGLDKLWVSPGVFKSLQLIRLDQIKKIEYKTYCPTIPTHLVYITDMNYPRQPMRVAIATAKDQPPDYLNRRWYVNQPWPYNETVFNNENDRFGHWDDSQAAPYNGTTSGWYCEQLQKWDTWEQMIADRGGEVLVPTSTYWDPSWPKDPIGWKSAGYVYDPNNPSASTNPPGAHQSTGTGAAINFWVGARDDLTDLSVWYNEPITAWWKESYGFRGYLDEVTIGVDFGSGNGGYVETTYDFEPEPNTPEVRTVALSQKQAILPTGTGVFSTYQLMNNTLLGKGGSGASKLAMRVKMWGRVLSWGTSSAFGYYFDLWDGSVPIDTNNYDPPYPWNPEKYDQELPPQGMNLWQRPLPVRVHIPYAPGEPPQIGDYWSATGYPVLLGWDHPIPDPQHNASEVGPQLYLYSTIENCEKLSP